MIRTEYASTLEATNHGRPAVKETTATATSEVAWKEPENAASELKIEKDRAGVEVVTAEYDPELAAQREQIKDEYQIAIKNLQKTLDDVQEPAVGSLTAIAIISEQSISDRCKSDVFTKRFAVFQSAWLIIQSIARAVHGLPITQLELAALAYVGCALFMYVCWWYKPFGAEHVTLVPANESDAEALEWKRARNFQYEEEGIFVFYLVLGLAAASFSAIHLVSWNWAFPSFMVKYIWIGFGLAATVSAIIGVFMGLLSDLDGYLGGPVTILVLLFIFVYSISRLGLVVLIFYCFSSMPATVYETVDWTKYIPHFS